MAETKEKLLQVAKHEEERPPSEETSQPNDNDEKDLPTTYSVAATVGILLSTL